MSEQTPKKLRIELPDTWRGIDTKEAYERVMAEADEEVEAKTKQTGEFFNEQRAKSIRTGIETRIGFDGDLVKRGVGDNILYTHSNAAFGILDYLLGNNERAGKIRTGIETRIGFDGELVKAGVGNDGLYTYSNVAFGILDITGKLKQIYDERK